MTSFLALFRDAWRRARDRKTVSVLVVLGLIVAVGCASIAFGRPVPAASLKRHLSQCAVDPRSAIGKGKSRFVGLLGLSLKRSPKITVREPTAEDDLPLGLANVAVAELDLPDLADFDRIVRRWRESQSTTPAGAPDQSDDAASLSAEERGAFLDSMLRGHGWETVIVRPRGDEPGRFLVAAATDHLSDLEGGWKISIFFGAMERDVSDASPAQMVVFIESGIADFLCSFIGMLVLLAAFGGAMPDLLQKGSLDLVLARPIGRTRLLLFTYGGAVLTVLLVVASILLACALTLSVRSGHFSLAFVGCAVTATAVFAAVYPVAMLIGYLTGSGTLATLGSIACWGLASLIAKIREWIATFADSPTSWQSILDWAYRFAPKTSDIGNLGVLWLGRTELSPQAFDRFKQQFLLVPDAGAAWGSTALFAAVVLAITVLLFRRREC